MNCVDQFDFLLRIYLYVRFIINAPTSAVQFGRVGGGGGGENISRFVNASARQLQSATIKPARAQFALCFSRA
jgi:hypothetical protein